MGSETSRGPGMRKPRMKYFTVIYRKNIHELRILRAPSEKEAIEFAMAGSGGMVDESSILSFPITKEEYDKHYN